MDAFDVFPDTQAEFYGEDMYRRAVLLLGRRRPSSNWAMTPEEYEEGYG